MCSKKNSETYWEETPPTVVQLFFRNGPARTLMFRTPEGSDCSSCALHPESQLARWLMGATAAQPGFPTMIRSLYVHTTGEPCVACQEQLIRFLDKYRLADRLRFVVEDAEPRCSCGGHEPEEALFETQFEDALTTSQKSTERKNARRQARAAGFNTRRRQVDHGIPLAQSHLDPRARAYPNRHNLRVVTPRVHREKDKMWNDYVLRTFYQHCTTPEQRRRKLTEIFAKLREKYPRDTVTHAFGKEIELLELEIF